MYNPFKKQVNCDVQWSLVAYLLKYTRWNSDSGFKIYIYKSAAKACNSI